MLLAIDVGNTNAVFAVHDGQRVVGEWRCRTERQRTADEYFVWLRQLMDFGMIEGSIDSVVVSSVVLVVGFTVPPPVAMVQRTVRPATPLPFASLTMTTMESVSSSPTSPNCPSVTGSLTIVVADPAVAV